MLQLASPRDRGVCAPAGWAAGSFAPRPVRTYGGLRGIRPARAGNGKGAVTWHATLLGHAGFLGRWDVGRLARLDTRLGEQTENQRNGMKTQVINDAAVNTPWLEHIPATGEAVEKTLLESFPFSIGRSESADLRIDSSRVSRTHAVIEQEGRGYRVRDNSSTNGTFVNGQQVDQARLEDGDMLVIADVEFSFFSRDASAAQQTATIVMDHGCDSGGGRSAVIDVIRGVRCYQEMLTHRSIVNVYEPILNLKTGDLFGYEAVRADEPRVAAASAQLLMATECRLTGRLHQLCRMVAVEETGPVLGSAHLFVKLYAAEIGTKGLAESLGKLRSTHTGGNTLVVEIPDSAVCNTPHFLEFVAHLRGEGIAVAFDGFAYGKAQLMEQKECPADFLKLADSLTRGIEQSRDRQRQVRSVVQAARDIGCEVIASGIRRQEEASTCLDVGCRYGQGSLAGGPRSIHTLLSPGCN